MQIKALQIKKNWEEKKAPEIKFEKKLIKDFVDSLPFKLTNAQRKASFEILKDLEKPSAMNRLLNGDVGSGKTIVAAIAALQTVSAGYQAVLMAPTEVLACQHFESFSALFKKYSLKIALLTNAYQKINASQSELNVPKKPAASKKNLKENLLNKIASGEIDLIIGTHALIQKNVRFKNPALTIIDEQHRFGVAQRAALQQETMTINDQSDRLIPHLLTMTATPIPRTLAIAFFGSLDLSFLDEMPKNRKPIITRAVKASGQKEVYAFAENQIRAGRQAFIIFPLVSESTKMSEVKAATEEYQRLSEKIFPNFRLGLMHGKLKPAEKESVMRKFKTGEFDILVSTSVVEVGVDIPNASVMIIENAERFGLSQLHQFRGRIGRGQHQSYCFLFSESDSERLKIMEKTNDGFVIAEKDLKLRGPGQFFGKIQAGLPDIAMENMNNLRLIKFTRLEARALLTGDPYLKKHPVTAEAIKKFAQTVHLE